MTDTDTNTVSLALYRFLCQTIVGTENHVKTIRYMNTVRDYCKNIDSHTSITSGSFGEGLEMRGSDLDMMHVEKHSEVYVDEKIRTNPNIAYYKMETDDVKPGFTQLLSDKNNIKLSNLCEEFNGKNYLSSTLFKQHIINSDTQMIHGPCISDKYGRHDHAFCLHCKTWISQASTWITRSNNSWPRFNVKQSIIKHGVLVVPIGVNGSPKENIEWRISFSVGEKMLISTFTHTQVVCYALLKILLKDVIATYTECSDLLCSYFLKTIILWMSEELPPSVWKPENLVPCFLRCFSRLIYSVEYSVCVHYFIPENNMFENKIEGRAREILLDKLYTLRTYGWRCVLFSDQLSKFHVSMSMHQFEPHRLQTLDVARTMNSKLLDFTNYMIAIDVKKTFRDKNFFYRTIRQIVSCDQSSHRYLFIHHMSFLCGLYAQSIQLTNTRRSNKHQYTQYNSCYCTLLQNIYHDAVSGWLMLATFFYKSKQYNKALNIIVYSISKCTSEKFYRNIDMSDIHYELLKLKSFQQKSLFRLWKILLVDSMKFEQNSSIIPNELQMEVENEEYDISSIVYAYFLKYLCHHHLNTVKLRQECLHTLQLVIAENYCNERDWKFKYKAYNILGIALQMSGDHEAAEQAFMKSVKLCPPDRFNTSMKRLSLMS